MSRRARERRDKRAPIPDFDKPQPRLAGSFYLENKMDNQDIYALPSMPDENMEEEKEYLANYVEATSQGPRTYIAFSEILHAIADGKRVEWLSPDGNWVYQHPSHTLKVIKGLTETPDHYRVVSDH